MVLFLFFILVSSESGKANNAKQVRMMCFLIGQPIFRFDHACR